MAGSQEFLDFVCVGDKNNLFFDFGMVFLGQNATTKAQNTFLKSPNSWMADSVRLGSQIIYTHDTNRNELLSFEIAQDILGFKAAVRSVLFGVGWMRGDVALSLIGVDEIQKYGVSNFGLQLHLLELFLEKKVPHSLPLVESIQIYERYNAGVRPKNNVIHHSRLRR